jgi:hypothetical protein
VSAEVTPTVWDAVADTIPTRRGFDFDGPFASGSHLAIHPEMVDPLDADAVRGSLLAIANQANWAACRSCDPASGKETRRELWRVAQRLEYQARRLGHEILKFESQHGDDDAQDPYDA